MLLVFFYFIFSHFKNILECCNYFSEEYGSGLVTLITGSDDLLESFDLMQMAKSIGKWFLQLIFLKFFGKVYF